MSQDTRMDKSNRFLNIYGTIFFILFLGSLYTLYVIRNIEDIGIQHSIFGIALTLWYLLTGIGVLIRKKWGYYLFKSFLYLLFICFPVGTVISYYSLGYVKKNKLIREFN